MIEFLREAEALGIGISRNSVGTVNNDISYVSEEPKYNIRKYVDEKLPYEYERCVIGL